MGVVICPGVKFAENGLWEVVQSMTKTFACGVTQNYGLKIKSQK